MKIEMITHESGDQIPLLLDSDGLPMLAPNEFILSRRFLSAKTLNRNLREIKILCGWFLGTGINFESRIRSNRPFSEAEIIGGLIECLNRDHSCNRKVRKIAVSPLTFNQRLITIRQYVSWRFNIVISSFSSDSNEYEKIIKNKNIFLEHLTNSLKSKPPSNKQNKGLTEEEVDFLLTILDPDNKEGFGKNPIVRFRNYVLVLIMLYYGLRPGELLKLFVEDVVIGAISSIRVERRPPDASDKRSPRPEIKRNGRVLPVDDALFAKKIDSYITEYRDLLEDKSANESDYLILSSNGEPLSQSSINQLFQEIRGKYPKDLPSNLSAKSLRHTFSVRMEKTLRNNGVDENGRRQALAYLRGDSSLSSQDVYTARAVEERAQLALKGYQSTLIYEDICNPPNK